VSRAGRAHEVGGVAGATPTATAVAVSGGSRVRVGSEISSFSLMKLQSKIFLQLSFFPTLKK
jgi:hypothetical protein